MSFPQKSSASGSDFLLLWNPNKKNAKDIVMYSIADFVATFITPVAGDWALNGNTVTAEKWFGTIDNFDLPIRTFNVEHARLKKTGEFNITYLQVGSTFEFANGTEGNGFVLTSDANGIASWQPGPGATTQDLEPVISQTNNPPGGPSTGDRYLVGTAPTGAWVGFENNVAEWDGAVWIFTPPSTNDVVFITATLTTKRWNGTAWVAYAGTAILQNGNSLTTNVIVGSNNAKAFQIKTNAIIRAQYTSAGNYNIVGNSFFGHISTTATARVHIRGVDTLAASYALKVENSTPSSLFAIQNDGWVGIGQAAAVGIEKFYCNGYSVMNGRMDLNGDLYFNASGFSFISSPSNDFIATFASGFQFKTLTVNLLNSTISGNDGNKINILTDIAYFKDAGVVDTGVYFAMLNDTAPGASVVDGFQMYSADIVAGNAAPHFRTEAGDIVKLFKGAALTASLTTVTHSAPGTPDYAIQDLVAGGFGFVTADEGQTALSVISNLQVRVNELEARLQASGQIV